MNQATTDLSLDKPVIQYSSEKDGENKPAFDCQISRNNSDENC